MTTENTESNVDENGFLKAEAVADTDTSGEHASAPEAPTPKRRGRPPKNAGLTQEKIESGGAAPKTASKSAKSGKKSFTQSDIGAMAKQLQGLHTMAAMITQMGELQIDDQEATMLASAIVNVSEQYDLAIDGKTGALIQILGCAAMIYVPRALTISGKVKAAKAARAATTFDNGNAPST